MTDEEKVIVTTPAERARDAGYVSQGRIHGLSVAIELTLLFYIAASVFNFLAVTGFIGGRSYLPEQTGQGFALLSAFLGLLINVVGAWVVRGLALLLVDWFVVWRDRGETAAKGR